MPRKTPRRQTPRRKTPPPAENGFHRSEAWNGGAWGSVVYTIADDVIERLSKTPLAMLPEAQFHETARDALRMAMVVATLAGLSRLEALRALDYCGRVVRARHADADGDRKRVLTADLDQLIALIVEHASAE